MGRRGPLPRPRDSDGDPLEPQAAAAVMERRAEVATAAGMVVDAPKPPPGLLAVSRGIWSDFWDSRAAAHVDRGAQMGRLIRWINDVDMWHRVQADLKPRRTSEPSEDEAVRGIIDPRRPWLGRGAADQVRRHPSADLLGQLDERIHRAEVEFGMTPYSEVRLGLAGVQGALTAEQLRKLLDERRRHRGDEPEREEWAEGYSPA